MLQKTFFRANVYNPYVPAETYTEVWSQTTAGAYSKSLDWGKYKIVFSGAGGSGGSVSSRTDSYTSASNGSNGETKTVYVTVLYGQTTVVSGTIGAGAAGSYTHIEYRIGRDNLHTERVGTPGTGYQSGNLGTANSLSDSNLSSLAAGSGGGSTSVIAGGTTNIAKGGNGGNCHAKGLNAYGGSGGSGGVSSGGGSAGGAGGISVGGNVERTSGSGSPGYVRIYKSNILPQG